MIVVTVRCPTPEAFKALWAGQPPGAVFCPTTQSLDAGTPVIVEILGRWLPNAVLIRGIVVSWRRHESTKRVRAGAVVRFPEDEAHKVQYVFAVADGVAKPTARRQHRRVPVLDREVRLGLAPGLDLLRFQLVEISVAGMLVRGTTMFPVGADVVMEVTAPGGVAPLDFTGRVLYHAPPDRMGIRITSIGANPKRRVRELIRRFRQPE